MAKNTTTKTAAPKATKTETAPVVEKNFAAPAPVVEKKVKKEKAPKQEVAAAPVTEVSSAPVVAEQTHEGEAPIAERSIEFLSKLQQMSVLISSLKSEFRTLEKQWTRDLKTAQKQSSKKKRKAGNRAPSGFVKPTRISDELAKFLDKPVGSEMARTEVTRDINKYIRSNNLQDKDNGRKINPDTKLSALLKIAKGEELTYFNLQKYMSPHFSKVAQA
jgi:upstream activation factor subunit UAF30